MKEEALKLADELDKHNESFNPWILHSSAMIRRLVEELDKQEHCCPDCGCHFVGEYPFNNAPQTKPLSDDEINEIAMYCSDMNEYGHSKLDEFDFARAIEERHGIK